MPAMIEASHHLLCPASRARGRQSLIPVHTVADKPEVGLGCRVKGRGPHRSPAWSPPQWTWQPGRLPLCTQVVHRLGEPGQPHTMVTDLHGEIELDWQSERFASTKLPITVRLAWANIQRPWVSELTLFITAKSKHTAAWKPMTLKHL